MKYTHGAYRRQGSHLTDLIGDDPMFCKVLRIVFTLFFFVSMGLPVPRFSGPDGSAAEPWTDLCKAQSQLKFLSNLLLLGLGLALQLY